MRTRPRGGAHRAIEVEVSWIESYVGYMLLLVRNGGLLLGNVDRLTEGTRLNSVVRSWMLNHALGDHGLPPDRGAPRARAPPHAARPTTKFAW